MLKVLTQSFGIDVRYFIQVSYSGLLPFLFLTLFYKIIRQPSYTKNLISFLTSPLKILYKLDGAKWTEELITYCPRRLLLLIRILCREISNNTNNLRKKWFWVGSDCWNFTLLCLWGLRENWRTHFEIFPVLQKEYYEFIQGSSPNCCNENSNTCMKQKSRAALILI